MGAQVQTSVTTGQALHDAVANGAVIQLGSLLNIQPNMTVTLDLNGHPLTRTGTESDRNNGQVIWVQSTASLTIKDTGTDGTITGGYALLTIGDGLKVFYNSPHNASLKIYSQSYGNDMGMLKSHCSASSEAGIGTVSSTKMGNVEFHGGDICAISRSLPFTLTSGMQMEAGPDAYHLQKYIAEERTTKSLTEEYIHIKACEGHQCNFVDVNNGQGHSGTCIYCATRIEGAHEIPATTGVDHQGRHSLHREVGCCYSFHHRVPRIPACYHQRTVQLC
jgi:hypothetical protein